MSQVMMVTKANPAVGTITKASDALISLNPFSTYRAAPVRSKAINAWKVAAAPEHREKRRQIAGGVASARLGTRVTTRPTPNDPTAPFSRVLALSSSYPFEPYNGRAF